MNRVNQKIIDAIIEKSEKVCPDSLAENIDAFVADYLNRL